MTRRVALIWNPSKVEEGELRDALGAVPDDDLDVTWWETTPDDPGQGVAAQALEAGCDLLIAAGGDGTVRAVAERVAEADGDVEFGIVPLGTGNLLARNLEVPLGDIGAALRRALEGEAREVDLGWVELEAPSGPQRHAFAVMVGFGIDAQMIAETDDDLKKDAGWLAYVESLGRAVTGSDVIDFGLGLDGAAPDPESAHTLLIANCGMLQGGITLLPDADPSDGRLDLLVLRAEGAAEWIGTLKTMAWDNGLRRLMGGEGATETAHTATLQATAVRVELSEPREFEIDGEEIGEVTAFDVTLQPAALRVR